MPKKSEKLPPRLQSLETTQTLEVRRLAVAAAKDSILDLTRLGDALARHPALLVDCLPVFFRYLDPSAVPPHAGVPDAGSQQRVALAIVAIIGLLDKSLGQFLASGEASNSLLKFWPQMRYWTDCIACRVVLDCHFGASMRDLGLKAMLAILVLYNLRREFQTLPIESFLVKIWARESRDELFRQAVLRTQDQRALSITTAVMRCYISKFFATATPEDMTDYTPFLPLLTDALGATKEEIASIMVDRIRQSTMDDRPCDRRLLWIHEELRLLVILALCTPLQQALLAQDCVRATVQALLHVTSPQQSFRADSLVLTSILNCAKYLYITVLDERDSHVHVQKAIEADLLLGVVRSSPWLDCSRMRMSPEEKIDTERAFAMFDNILTGWLPRRAVFREAHRAVAKLRDCIADNHAGNSPISDILERLKRVVTEWEPALRNSKSMMASISVCNNRKCTVSAPGRTPLKKCTGCMSAGYCSPECQRYDWKFGDHRASCRQMQKGIQDGTKMVLGNHGDDKGFTAAIRSIEIAKHQETIDAALRDVPPGIVPVFELDLRHAPATISFLPFDSEGNTVTDASDTDDYQAHHGRALARGHGLLQLTIRQGDKCACSYFVLPLRRTADGLLARNELCE